VSAEEISMADLPSHPGDDSGTSPGPGRPPPSRPGWRAAAGIVNAVVLFVLVIVRHVTGTLGLGGH